MTSFGFFCMFQGSIFTVLNVSHLKEMFRECFKKRANYGRSKLLLTIAATALATFTLYGASSLIYLYTRNKLQWTMKDFTTFSAIGTVWVMGGFFGVALIQKFLHISDLSFAAIAMVSCIAESIIKALATTSWHMYLGKFCHDAFLLIINFVWLEAVMDNRAFGFVPRSV